MIRRALLVVPVAVLLAAAACSSDESAESTSGGGDAELARALGGLMHEDAQGDPSSMPIELDEAECMAGVMLGVVGTEPFDEAGITAQAIDDGDVTSDDLDGIWDGTLDEAQAGEVWDGLQGCIDFAGMLADELAGTGALGISDESARCVAEAMVDSPVFRAEMISGFVEDESLAPSPEASDSEFERIFGECLSDDELENLGL